MDKDKAVLYFISENFDPDKITIEKSNLLPFAQIIKDSIGGQMMIYFDLLTDSVKWKFPAE